MNVADELERAADYIDEHGWTQGVLSNTVGEVCTVGAFDVCGVLWSSWIAFGDWLGLARGPGGCPKLADWNDAEHRTREQVVKELRACAADLRDAS